jgi:hypothetical protein
VRISDARAFGCSKLIGTGNRDNGRELICVGDGEGGIIPGGTASHAKTRKIDPVSVYFIVSGRIVEEAIDIIRGWGIGELRGEDYKRESFAVNYEAVREIIVIKIHRQAGLYNIIQVGSSIAQLATSVNKENEWVSRICSSVISFWKILPEASTVCTCPDPLWGHGLGETLEVKYGRQYETGKSKPP